MPLPRLDEHTDGPIGSPGSPTMFFERNAAEREAGSHIAT